MKHKELNSNLKFGEKKLFSELYSLWIRIRGRELLDESLYQPQQKETLENKLNNSFNVEREKCLAATIWFAPSTIITTLSSLPINLRIWLKDDRWAQKKNISTTETLALSTATCINLWQEGLLRKTVAMWLFPVCSLCSQSPGKCVAFCEQHRAAKKADVSRHTAWLTLGSSSFARHCNKSRRYQPEK